jgi:aldose 1-epimerase
MIFQRMRAPTICTADETGSASGSGKARPDPQRNAICLELASDDGDQGHPARLVASVTYALSSTGDLGMGMRAEADAPTIVNLVHHGYWNLAGHGGAP